jgi:hypothetical protein
MPTTNRYFPTRSGTSPTVATRGNFFFGSRRTIGVGSLDFSKRRKETVSMEEVREKEAKRSGSFEGREGLIAMFFRIKIGV